MAIPTIKTLRDCADYHKVVEPFIPQLYELPRSLYAFANAFAFAFANTNTNANTAHLEGLKTIYLDTNPLVSGCAVSLVVGFLALVVSEVNGNFSQIDRLWSILPNLYVVHNVVWARLTGLPHTRLDMVAVATTIWSIRLTYNYWRKGGYQIGSEDYRWEIAKSYVPRFVWSIFNLVFISFAQSILLFLFSAAPTYVMLLSAQIEQQLKTTDYVYFGVMLALVAAEWVADGQQWDYQNAKKLYKKNGTVSKGFTQADLERGFIIRGLWAYSRHPNFLCEQVFWFALYNWSCYASASPYSWAGAGAFSLIFLFQGSTVLTESISRGKYPHYLHYQREIGMFIPISVFAYQPPVRQPKIIKASEVAKRQEEKEKQQQKQKQKQK